MIEFENVNFEELKHMDLEEAKEIVKQFDEVTWLEDVGCEFNGERYGTEALLESDWDDGGKYQYKEEYGLLCKLDNDYTVIEKYDVCIVNDITRSGSYFSKYYYETELRVERIIEKVIPEVVIPEHTVITIGEQKRE